MPLQFYFQRDIVFQTRLCHCQVAHWHWTTQPTTRVVIVYDGQGKATTEVIALANTFYSLPE